MIGIECPWDDATAGGYFSNVLDTNLHLDCLCPGEAQLLLESTTVGAVGQLESVTLEGDPSERMCIFIKILNALKLSFKELTSAKNKKCNGEVSGKAWGD